jgi:hypothetical protein
LNNLGTFYAVKHPGLEDRWGDAPRCWKKAKELGFDCGDPYPPFSTLINAGKVGPSTNLIGRVERWRVAGFE